MDNFGHLKAVNANNGLKFEPLALIKGTEQVNPRNYRSRLNIDNGTSDQVLLIFSHLQTNDGNVYIVITKHVETDGDIAAF